MIKLSYAAGVQQALIDAGLCAYASDDIRLIHANAAVKIAMGPEDVTSDAELLNLISTLLQMQDSTTDTGAMDAQDTKGDVAEEITPVAEDHQNKVAIFTQLLAGAKALGGTIAKHPGAAVSIGGAGLVAGGATAAEMGKRHGLNTLKQQAPISYQVSRAEKKLRGFN